MRSLGQANHGGEVSEGTDVSEIHVVGEKSNIAYEEEQEVLGEEEEKEGASPNEGNVALLGPRAQLQLTLESLTKALQKSRRGLISLEEAEIAKIREIFRVATEEIDYQEELLTAVVAFLDDRIATLEDLANRADEKASALEKLQMIEALWDESAGFLRANAQ